MMNSKKANLNELDDVLFKIVVESIIKLEWNMSYLVF